MTDNFYFGDGQLALPRVFRPGDLWEPVADAPKAEAEYRSFALEGAPLDPNKPAILGVGNMFGPVVGAVLSDGRRPAAKLFLPVQDHIDREVLYEHAAHEYRRASTDLGPRFVRARALFETDANGAPAFVMLMDRINGKTLNKIGTPRIGFDQQVRWTSQMLDALGVLRAHELAWQDIKPGNLMLDELQVDQANLVFIDHGSARKIRGGTHTNQQHTPEYLAPECLTKRDDSVRFTYQSDLFSAGVTLLDVFTQGNAYLDSQDARYRTTRGAPNLNSPLIDHGVREVLRGMLVRDPAKRPSLDELGQVLHGQPPAGWDPDPYAPWETAEEPKQSRTQPMPPRPSSTITEPTFTRSASNGFTPIDPDPNTEVNMSPQKPQSSATGPEGASLLPLLDDETAPAQENPLMEFAGVDSRWVSVPSERKAYAAAGVALIVYLAYIIAGCAAVGYQMSGSVLQALAGMFLVGPILGFALVNLDRTIVGSISPNLDKLDDAEITRTKPIKRTVGFWTGVMVRTLVALLASFVIGDAINVQLHANDVQAQLITEQAQRISVLPTAATTRFQGKLDAAQQAVLAAQQARDKAEKQGEIYTQNAKDEEQGLGATGKKTCGPVCEDYIKKARIANEYWDTNKTKLESDVTTAKQGVQAVEQEKATYLAAETVKIQEEVSGPVARARALFEFATKDFLTGLIYWSVIAVFMAVELSAILIKLLNLNSSYERDTARRIRRAEYAALKDGQRQINHVNLVSEANESIQQDTVMLDTAAESVKIQRRAAWLADQLGTEPIASRAATHASTRSGRPG